MTTHPVLELASSLQSQWEAILESIRVAHQSRLDRQADIHALTVCDAQAILCEWGTRIDLRNMYLDFARTLERQMTLLLTQQGYPVKINLYEFADYGDAPNFRFSQERDQDRFFFTELAHAKSRSLLVVGQRLVERYSLSNAKVMALNEASDRVFRYFVPPAWSKDKSAKIMDRKGLKILTRQFYGDTCHPWTLNYGARNELKAIVESCALLLIQADLCTAINEKGKQAMAGVIETGLFTSRQNIELGPGMTLVFYKDKIEFHFNANVFKTLYSTISQHRSDEADAA